MLDFKAMRETDNIKDAKIIIEMLIEAFEDKFHAIGIIYGLSTIGLRCNNPQEFYKALKLIQNASKMDFEKKEDLEDPVFWAAENWDDLSIQYWDLTTEEAEERAKIESEKVEAKASTVGKRNENTYQTQLKRLERLEPRLKKKSKFKKLRTFKEVRKNCGRKKKSGSKIEKKSWD